MVAVLKKDFDGQNKNWKVMYTTIDRVNQKWVLQLIILNIVITKLLHIRKWRLYAIS
ncbi:MAG: hypothetical protein ACI9XC_001965 [Gammaproteobacteria bacterium]|jgi:hypothetical protein